MRFLIWPELNPTRSIVISEFSCDTIVLLCTSRTRRSGRPTLDRIRLNRNPTWPEISPDHPYRLGQLKCRYFFRRFRFTGVRPGISGRSNTHLRADCSGDAEPDDCRNGLSGLLVTGPKARAANDGKIGKQVGEKRLRVQAAPGSRRRTEELGEIIRILINYKSPVNHCFTNINKNV